MKTILRIATLIILVCQVSKTTNAQTWQWADKAGGTGNNFSGGIDVDDSGNSYVAGTFYDSISIGATTLINAGNWSVYISKYDVSGNLIWAKIVASDSAISVNAICLDKSGKIFIAGHFFGTAIFGPTNPVSLVSSGDFDVYVAECYSNGKVKWARSSGGPGVDYIGGISTDNNGNVFITGDFHLNANPPSAGKIFVAKYDSAGNNIWLKMPQNYGNFHYGMGIKTDTNGNSYITGQFFNSLIFDSAIVLNAGNIESNTFIAKFNSEGVVLWMQRAGASSGYCGGNDIAIDDAGNCYITGYFRGTILFGSLFLAGMPGLYYQTFIAKCDSNGNYIWINKSIGSGLGKGISTDNNGSVYVAGIFGDTISFGNSTLINSGSGDIFIARANSSGSFIDAMQCGGMAGNNFSGIKANSQGVFITGNYTDTINFGTSISLVSDSSDLYDVFLARVGSTTFINEENNSNTEIALFPDPAINEIQLLGIQGRGKYIIFDITGKVMDRGKLNNADRISVESLRSGIYFIQFIPDFNSEKSGRFKFIKG